MLLACASSTRISGLLPPAHASFVEKVAEHGGGIRTAAAAFYIPTFERRALKRVPLVGVYAKCRDGYGALRLILAATITPACSVPGRHHSHDTRPWKKKSSS